MKSLLPRIATGCATIVVFFAMSPLAAQAFFFIFPSPGPFIFVLFGSSDDRSFSFTAGYGANYVEFFNISTNADAQHLADVLRSNPSITEDGDDVVFGSIRISGYAASERTVLISKLRSITAITTTSYLNDSGVLRYRAYGSIDPITASDELNVTIRTTRSLAFQNQPFTLQWANVNLADGSCQLTSSGSTPVLPSGATLQANGSATLQINIVGDYLFTYQCNSGVETASDIVSVRVFETDIPEPVFNVSGADCVIPSNMYQCEVLLYWDTYLSDGTFTSVTLTNVTTASLLSTDESGLSRPTNVRYGNNTISLVGDYTTSSGVTGNVSETFTVTASCAAEAVWNGSICVPSDGTGGGWDVISDIDFYGKGYVGMPALQPVSAGPDKFNHDANISCQRLRFWACSTVPHADPVGVEIFADSELIYSGRANIPDWDTVKLSSGEPHYGEAYGFMPACMSGLSDHALTKVDFLTPRYLKDDVERNITIRATRSDGVSRMVAWNAWVSSHGYPDGIFQNFPLKCAPSKVEIVDLAAILEFPSEVTANVPQAVTNARVANYGELDLTTSAEIWMHFDYGRDSFTDGSGAGLHDFTSTGTVSNIGSGETIFANLSPVVFPIAGNWRVRLGVDPNKLIETEEIHTEENNWPRQNNWTHWHDFTVVDSTTQNAEINPGQCTVPAGETTCETTVTWWSTNFVGGTQVLQNDILFGNSISSTGVKRYVSFTNRTFFIRSVDGSFIANASARVLCDGEWDMTKTPPVCLDANPVEPILIKIIPQQTLIRIGDEAKIEVEVTSNTHPASCTIQGLFVTESTPEEFVYDPGTHSYSFETDKIWSPRQIEVSCESGDVRESESITIRVVPISFES